jgi:hypothetical protein
MGYKNELCDDCKKLGYCIMLVPVEIPEKYLTEREIRNKVPIRSMDPDASKKFLQKLQQAHDLFHQEEYEQASYLYQDMLTTRNNCDEVKVGLAASFYFLKKYDEAAAMATRIDGVYTYKFGNELIKVCEKKMKENQEKKSPSSVQSSTCHTKTLIAQ